MEYLVRDIDPAFWQKIRQRADRDGWPNVKMLLLSLLAAWLRGQIKITAPPWKDGMSK